MTTASSTGPADSGRPVRVVLIDDEALVRAGLRMILESSDDLLVVGETVDGADAVGLVRRARPDVVLMDIRMPVVDGLAATSAVRALPDPPQVMILTTFDADDQVFRALEAGAAGFLLKDTAPADLIQAVRLVASGSSMLSPAITRQVIDRFASAGLAATRQQEARHRLAPLTAREREVLIEVGNGLSNAEIGTRLNMSEATVKSHVSRLFEKLGLGNRVQVAILAHRAGLVT